MIKLKIMNLSSFSLGKSKNGRILLRIYTLLEFNRQHMNEMENNI